MTVRSAAPQQMKKAGRSLAVRSGTATSRLRMLPAFLLAGAQRAGTTSLFRALMTHPLILPANFHKGVNYFDVNYHRGPDWYRGHFPLATVAQFRTRGLAGAPVTFDASGYYLFHPLAGQRIGADLPQAKVLVMLRDPVERAYSAHKHELARGFETEPFEQALALEDQRLAGQVERICAEPGYYSASHRHHAYRRRGHYAEQLLRLRESLPAAHILAVESERFFSQPEAEYTRVLEFLELPVIMPARFDRYNGRPGSPMADATRAELQEHFAPHDMALAELLGREPVWMR